MKQQGKREFKPDHSDMAALKHIESRSRWGGASFPSFMMTTIVRLSDFGLVTYFAEDGQTYAKITDAGRAALSGGRT